MILQRLATSIRKQDWFTVAVETLIVVLGVFLGLQVQQWAQEQGRRQLEASYTSRLHDDVVRLLQTRRPTTQDREMFNDLLISLAPVLFGVEDRAITTEECGSVGYTYLVSNPTDELAALIELQSSGQLSLFRNKEVSEAVQAFLLTRSRARDSQAGISGNDEVLTSKYPDLIQVVTPAVVAERPTTATFRCDLEGMKTDPEFLNDFEFAKTNFGLHVADNARVTASLTELHRVLDEHLDITHAEGTSP
ncbi:MAG: hypothetical protein GC152_04270 [Alphaproteobacteria bacterium]|nr:hypothetical protein [Alphaproteobacteria bacterium]